MASSISLPFALRTELEQVCPNVRDLVLYVNSSCNLRCKHCYVGTKLLDSNYAYSTGDVCRFIGEFQSLDRLTILGGEPLLHPGINTILLASFKREVGERRITTNLTGFFFLNPAAFCDRKNLTFAVSLDGADAATHDAVRGDGAFDKTLENLSYLINIGCDVEITHTVTNRNIGEFDALLGLCGRLGVRKLNLHKVSLHGNAMDNRDLAMTPTQWVTFCKGLEERSRRSRESNGFLSVRYPPIYVTMAEFRKLLERGEYWGHKARSYYSPEGGSRIVLYSDGRIYVSSELFGTESHVGRIHDGRFEPNGLPTSEMCPENSWDDPMLLSKLNGAVAGDVDYPVALSVSFKRTVRYGYQ